MTGAHQLLLPLVLVAVTSVPAEPRADAQTSDCPALGAVTPPPYWVCHAGSRRAMFETGDLGATIDLERLDDVDNLFAIGPIEGLQGEISVVDGRASIATIDSGRPVFSSTRSASAIFLVYGAANAFQPVDIPIRLVGLGAVEAFIHGAASEAGLDLKPPFPFRIETAPERLVYHIIFRDEEGTDTDAQAAQAPKSHREMPRHGPRHGDNAMKAHAMAGPAPETGAYHGDAGHGGKGLGHHRGHDHAAHRRAKKSFELAGGTPADLFGFIADAAGEGVYTHEGKRMHLHVIASDGSASGHVDDLVVPAGAVLFLPRAAARPDA